MCEKPDDPTYSQILVNEDIEFIKPENKVEIPERPPIPFRRKFAESAALLTPKPQEGK